MLGNTLEKTTLEQIAEKLEEDMRSRGLRPGDRYLTAAEACKLFDVSPVTANRAMHLLAERQYLIRQRSRGTFVGPKFESGPLVRPVIDVVHVLMAVDIHQTRVLTGDDLVNGLRSTLPGTTVNIHYLSQVNSTAYAQRLLDQINRNGDTVEAVILFGSSQPVQLLVEQAKVPAVVFGNLYSGVRQLSYIKHDQDAAGRLMAQNALRHGHRRFALLTRSEWRLGDNRLLEALTFELSEAGVGLNDLCIRSLSPERISIAESARSLLTSSQPPTAFFCRNEYFADVVVEVADELGLQVGRDLHVVSAGHMESGGTARYARVLATVDIAGLVESLGRTLLKIADGSQTEPTGSVIPVKLCDPEDS